MNELALSGKTMTVREVAEALGVSPDTILYSIKKLEAQSETFRVEKVQGVCGGKPYYVLTEAQVTAVKNQIGTGRNDLQNVLQVKNAVTALDIERMTLQVIEYHRGRVAMLEAENAKQAERLAIAEPKADALDKMTASESDISVRELAAILAVPHLGQNNLFQRLRDDGYIDGFNRPYRKYIEAGLMYEKEYYVPSLDATKRQLRITQKGAAHFAGKYALAKTA